MQCLCQEREDRNIKSCFLHYLMKDSASRFLHLSDLYVNETVKDHTYYGTVYTYGYSTSVIILPHKVCRLNSCI